MSKASTIHDDLLARLATLLPAHFKMANAYRLEANVDTELGKGFGVTVGPAENTRRMVCPRVSVRRQYGVVLARRALQNDFDTDVKTTVEKELFEDQILVIKDLEFNPTLTSGIALDTRFESDTGIQFVTSNDEEFMILTTTFTVEYIENLP